MKNPEEPEHDKRKPEHLWLSCADRKVLIPVALLVKGLRASLKHEIRLN